jgi:diguanylate cyclase (GGDEF)-like protein
MAIPHGNSLPSPPARWSGGFGVAFNGHDDGSLVAILEQLRLTADLAGLAILDLSQDTAHAPIAYLVGQDSPNIVLLGRALLTANLGCPSHMRGPDGRPILACPWVLPPTRPGGLVMWRTPEAPAWTEADHDLAASVAMLLRHVIGAGMGQIGIDRLTGLPNRRWFLDQVDRHIDRLDVDATTGTLVLVDIDDLRGINLTQGWAQGDRVLIRMADQLQAMVRPSDLVARVGADEFAIWQDGMDHLTAAERAETLCAGQIFQDLPVGHGTHFSVGIASRTPGSTEDVRTLLRRAHMAAREVKSIGGGGWRVSHVEPVPPGQGFPE